MFCSLKTVENFFLKIMSDAYGLKRVDGYIRNSKRYKRYSVIYKGIKSLFYRILNCEIVDPKTRFILNLTEQKQSVTVNVTLRFS